MEDRLASPHGPTPHTQAPSWRARTSHTYVFPDFSGVAGFDTRWVPPTSTAETINLGATAHTMQQNGSTQQITRSSVTGSYRVTP